MLRPTMLPRNNFLDPMVSEIMTAGPIMTREVNALTRVVKTSVLPVRKTIEGC